MRVLGNFSLQWVETVAVDASGLGGDDVGFGIFLIDDVVDDVGVVLAALYDHHGAGGAGPVSGAVDGGDSAA